MAVLVTLVLEKSKRLNIAKQALNFKFYGCTLEAFTTGWRYWNHV